MNVPVEISAFIQSAASKNTLEKTTADIRRIRQFLEIECEVRAIEEIPAAALDLLMAKGQLLFSSQ